MAMSKRLISGRLAAGIKALPDSFGHKRTQSQKTVRFVPDVATALKTAARKRGVSENQLINEAVARELGVDIDAFIR